MEKKIKVAKTARYFTNDADLKQVKYVWFVCHGYGQLAEYFIKKFSILSPEEHFVVAPEGLNRFYLSGVSGRVAATWMTKEAREDDIADYIQYLDSVYNEVLNSRKNSDVKIIVLGFSQGVATVCRWLSNGNSKADRLILWAGSFPPDLNFLGKSEILNHLNILYLWGDQDEYATEESKLKIRNILQSEKIEAEFIPFKGKHAVYPNVLQTEVLPRIIQD